MNKAPTGNRELRRQARQLRRLAAEYRASIETNVVKLRTFATPFVFRDPADLPRGDANPARKALRDFAASLGGLERMVEVYDLAIERYGFDAVSGVSSAWSGIEGWAA